MTEQPACAIVQLGVTDMDRFWSGYAAHMAGINRRHGAELVVGTPEVRVLEASYAPNFTVVLRFPLAVALDAWYADPDYQPLKALRLQSLADPARSTLVVAPPFQPSAA